MSRERTRQQAGDRVLVYGSLKRGFYNHPILYGARFLGAVATAGRYRLYSLGPYPAVVPDQHKGYPVEGELYEVDDETLARLDELEGHPEYYRRHRVATSGGEAWLYLLPTIPEDAEELRTGIWT